MAHKNIRKSQVDGLDEPTIDADLQINLGDQTVGGLENGHVYEADTPIETILRDALVMDIPPTYEQPEVDLSSQYTIFDYEIGTQVSPVLATVFTQNNAGALATRQLKKNGTNLSAATPFTDSNVTLGTTPVTYQSHITYAQGACINNPLGTNDCRGRVEAGAIDSNVLTFNGLRKWFAGSPSATPATSDDVRALAQSGLGPVEDETQIVINVPQGATRIIFAYPATIRDAVSAEYVEWGGAEVLGNFTKTTINVKGTNNFAATSYKMYEYVPVEPFPSACTYIISL